VAGITPDCAGGIKAESRPGQGAAFVVLQITTTATTDAKVREMDISPQGHHRQGQRARLPNRRPAETIGFEHAGARYQLTAGFHTDGSLGEVFLNHARSDSLLDALAHDAAIVVSLALQFGCPLEVITHALKRDTQGTAASPLGAALDRIAP
jgi:hypothetical protein